MARVRLHLFLFVGQLYGANFFDCVCTSTREGDPFTAVVDGANVAYFGFPELHYSQVEKVVDELRRMGENPLVVLPKKYTQRKFLLSHTRRWQSLKDREHQVIQR